MPEPFDPYYEWLGIPPKDQPPNHYRLLGIELFEENLNVIDRAADRQMGHVRSFQTGKHVKESQRLLNELSSAKVTLLSASKRADYDRQLRAQLAAHSTSDSGLADDAPIPELPPGVPEESSSESPSAASVRKSAATPVPAIEIRPTRKEVPATQHPEQTRFSRRKLVALGIAIVLVVGTVSAASFMMFGGASSESLSTSHGLSVVQDPNSGSGTTNSTEAAATPNSTTDTPNGNPSTDASPAANVSRFAAINESLGEMADPPSVANPPQVPATIRNTITAESGMFHDRFAFCQTLLWTRFDEINQALRAQGFRLTRCRPYLAQGDWRVAAIWLRDGQPSRVVGLTDSETLLQADERLREQGFVPVDVSGGADGPLELFVAVWARPQSPVGQSALSIGIAVDDYQASQDQMSQQGLRCAIHSVFHDSTGKKKFCDLWVKPAVNWSQRVWEGDSSAVEEHLSKASLYTDVCAVAVPKTNDVHFVGTQWFDEAAGKNTPGPGSLPDPVKSFVGIHPDAVRNAVAEQVKAGYFPDTLSVASAADGKLVSVSLWRPGDAVKSPLQLASLEPPSPTSVSTPAPAPAATTGTEGALHFAGKGSIELRDTVQLLDIHQDFTVEAWLRFDEQAFGVVNILCGTAAYRGLHPEVGTMMMKGWLAGIKPARAPAKSQLILQWAEAGGTTQNHTGEIPGFDNAWHHLALCNRGSSGRWELVVYVDGRESFKASYTDSKDVSSPVGFYFGRPQWVAASRRAMHGLLRGLRLSSGVRYSASFQPEKNLPSDEQTLALLDFSKRTGNSIEDIAGKRQPAPLDNLTWTDLEGNAVSKTTTAAASSNAAGMDTIEKLKPPTDYQNELAKVREVFKIEITSAKDPLALAALAEKILAQAADERDSTLQYALFTEARRFATDGVDWNVAVRTIDELAARFDVDVWEIRAEVFNGLAKKVKLSSDRKLLADKALSQAESALADGVMDVVDSLLASASNLAPRGDRELVREINEVRKRLTEEKKIQLLVRDARAKLANDPHDAAANESLGKYLCFSKEDWSAGIPHLAKGPDGKLKSVALTEATEPTDAAGWVSLANAWHDLGKSTSDTVIKSGAMHRALHWYQLAQPDLSGVNKTQVDKYVEELSKAVATSSRGKIKFAWLDGAPGVAMELRGHTGEGTSLAVTRTGRFLVSGSLDDTIRVWDLSSGKQSGQIIPATGDVVSVLLSPDDRIAIPVAANGEYSIGILSLQNRQLAGTMKADAMARQMAGSQDWRRVVYSKNQAGQNNLLVYNLAALSPMAALSCPGIPVQIAVSRSGRFLAAGDDNNVVYVWDLQSGKIGSPLTGHNEGITGLAFSPNERQLVSSSYRSVIAWDLVKGVEEQRIRAPDSGVTALAFSPDGSRLILSGSTIEISVHNAQTGLLIAQVRAPEGSEQSQTRAITCFADGRAAATVGTDGLIRIWRMPE